MANFPATWYEYYVFNFSLLWSLITIWCRRELVMGECCLCHLTLGPEVKDGNRAWKIILTFIMVIFL